MASRVIKQLKKDFSSFSFSDDKNKNATKSNYSAEPYGAIYHLSLKKELQSYNDAIVVFLETSHPIKFLNSVEQLINI